MDIECKKGKPFELRRDDISELRCELSAPRIESVMTQTDRSIRIFDHEDCSEVIRATPVRRKSAQIARSIEVQQTRARITAPK